jgi:hypothetical protein
MEEYAMKTDLKRIRLFDPVDPARAEELTEKLFDASGKDCLHHLVQQYLRGDIDDRQFLNALDIAAEDAKAASELAWLEGCE